MKPIETIYKGYRFRSRLEARWAVVFDTIEADWEYEPEGYTLENGEKYLPDFLLHNVRLTGSDEPFELYVEVKGIETQKDRKKMWQFAKELQKDGKWLMVVNAVPEWNDISVMATSAYLAPAEKCYALLYMDSEKKTRIHVPHWFEIDWYRTYMAYVFGRQARFEHGENPQALVNDFLQFEKDHEGEDVEYPYDGFIERKV